MRTGLRISPQVEDPLSQHGAAQRPPTYKQGMHALFVCNKLQRHLAFRSNLSLEIFETCFRQFTALWGVWDGLRGFNLTCKFHLGFKVKLHNSFCIMTLYDATLGGSRLAGMNAHASSLVFVQGSP